MGSICCGTLTLQVIINGSIMRFLRVRKTIEASKYIHLEKKSILLYPGQLFPNFVIRWRSFLFLLFNPT